jgi:hypothetical protein
MGISIILIEVWFSFIFLFFNGYKEAPEKDEPIAGKRAIGFFVLILPD